MYIFTHVSNSYGRTPAPITESHPALDQDVTETIL